MNYNNLVEIIIEELYKKIKATDIEVINKPTAVILYENNKDKFDLLRDEFDILGFDKTINDCDIVIVSRLCIRGICNLALGSSASDEERFILKMLMKGKKVYVLDEGIEYKRYKDTAPKYLYSKYLSYEDDICKFGVEVIKDISTISTKNKIGIVNTKQKNLSREILSKEEVKIDDKFSLDLRSKKLISESDLKKPMVSGIKSIIVNNKSIITPLAVDFMRIHNIKLKRI